MKAIVVLAAVSASSSCGGADPAGLIAFSSNRDGDYEIYIAHPDGSGLRQLTFNAVADLLPAWSPDGRRLAFVRGKWDHQGVPDRSRVMVMHADGSRVRELTPGPHDMFPTWAPSGRTVAYSKRSRHAWKIWEVALAGSGRPLSIGGSDYFAPSFAPFGRELVAAEALTAGKEQMHWS